MYENVRNIPEDTRKNDAQRCLLLTNWRPTCAESHEDLFMEVIPKASAQDLCETKYLRKWLPS